MPFPLGKFLDESGSFFLLSSEPGRHVGVLYAVEIGGEIADHHVHAVRSAFAFVGFFPPLCGVMVWSWSDFDHHVLIEQLAFFFFCLQIKTSTRLLYDNNVQPRIDQLTEIKDNTMRMCADAKYYGSSKLSEAKSLGPVGLVKTMVPVDRVNQTVEWSLNAADSLVDKLLPEGAKILSLFFDWLIDYKLNSLIVTGESDLPSSGADGAGNLDHAKLLSNKLRQRIYSRIAENAQTAQLVAQAFHLVNSLKDSSAGHSVQHVLDEVRRLSGAVDLGEVSLHNVESHTLALVKSLTTQLKDKLEASRQHLTEYLPTGAQDRLHQATDAAKDIFHQVREVIFIFCNCE